MTYKASPQLFLAIEDFDRDMVISYPELLRAFEVMNRQFRSGEVRENEDLNPRDLPGGKDWPDSWATRIWRDVQRDRVRKMKS